MKTVALLAPGESLPDCLADLPSGIDCIAVNNSFRLRPDAVALAAADIAWWMHTPDAMDFAGRKFCARKHPGTEQPDFHGVPLNGINSGALAMVVARQLGYTRMLLLGFDGHGSHYHGDHPAPLKNSGPVQFARHRQQFRFCRWPGVEIINCTPGSAVDVFPKLSLKEALCATSQTRTSSPASTAHSARAPIARTCHKMR